MEQKLINAILSGQSQLTINKYEIKLKPVNGSFEDKQKAAKVQALQIINLISN